MRLLTMKQVAEITGLPLWKVYDASRRDLMPRVRVGKSVFVGEEQLAAWCESGGAARPRDWTRHDSRATSDGEEA